MRVFVKKVILLAWMVWVALFSLALLGGMMDYGFGWVFNPNHYSTWLFVGLALTAILGVSANHPD